MDFSECVIVIGIAILSCLAGLNVILAVRWCIGGRGVMCESERHTRGLLFQFQEVVVKCRHSTRLPILLFALNYGRVCHPRSAVRDSLPPSFKKKVAQHRSDREKMVPTRETMKEKNPRSHRSLIERERQPRIFLLVRVNHAKKKYVLDRRAGTNQYGNNPVTCRLKEKYVPPSLSQERWESGSNPED